MYACVTLFNKGKKQKTLYSRRLINLWPSANNMIYKIKYRFHYWKASSKLYFSEERLANFYKVAQLIIRVAFFSAVSFVHNAKIANYLACFSFFLF